jgi:hypothetical protein
MGCILFPIAALGIGVWIARSHHQTFYDYVRLSVASGKGIASQGVAWAAWIFWVAKITPVSIRTMRHAAAISTDGERATIFGEPVVFSSVSRFLVKKRIFDNRLIAQTSAGDRDLGSIVLLREPAEEITSRLNGELRP